MKRTKISNWIVLGFIVIGILGSGYIMYTGVEEARIPPVCFITLIVTNC